MRRNKGQGVQGSAGMVWLRQAGVFLVGGGTALGQAEEGL
jgi:hypothetical protein